MAPAAIKLQVLNGATQRGQAAIVTATLQQDGFAHVAAPGNDTIFDPAKGHDYLDCRAQIRFGPNGASAARTMSVVEPCAQLVRDDRQDTSVNLVIGTQFDQLIVRPAARNALAAIERAAGTLPTEHGGQSSIQDAAVKVPAAMLNKARAVHC